MRQRRSPEQLHLWRPATPPLPFSATPEQRPTAPLATPPPQAKRRCLYRIRPSDVGRDFGDLPGCKSLGPQEYAFGAVSPCDVGKRLWKVGEVVQLESADRQEPSA